MSYSAEVFNIMIASPSDVEEEREVIREVIHSWNAVHSEKYKMVLMPIGWETHSSPEMGNTPQSIINKQILHKCDLLVGVFWTRIGTETAEYESGTIEEIERHTESGKLAMLYFSSQPVSPDSVNEKQLSSLREFRQEAQSKGLYEKYDSVSEFRVKFNKQLQLKINNDEMFKTITQSSNIEELKPLESYSEEEIRILIEGSKDIGGNILHLIHMGGEEILVNELNLLPSQEARIVAKWKSALSSLKNRGLLEVNNHSKLTKIYKLTAEAYKEVDRLNNDD